MIFTNILTCEFENVFLNQHLTYTYISFNMKKPRTFNFAQKIIYKFTNPQNTSFCIFLLVHNSWVMFDVRILRKLVRIGWTLWYINH